MSRAISQLTLASWALWLASAPVVAQQLKVDTARQAMEIHPPELKSEKVEVRLSSPADDLALGAGGRYIILHHPSERKLSIFDINSAEFVKSVPADDDNVRFAAALDKLVVILANTSAVQRYNLLTLERDKSLGLPGKAKVDHVTLGYNGKGPMLVTGKSAAGKQVAFFVNIYNMELVSYNGPDLSTNAFFDPSSYFRASANNRVFTKWIPHLSPQGFFTVLLSGTQLKEQRVHDSFGHLVPGPDGSHIYTARGIYTPEGKTLSKDKRNAPWTLPAIASNDYYISVDVDLLRRKPQVLNVHFTGDDRALATLAGVELPKANQWDRDTFGADKRIMFIPDADLIVTVPDGEDRLVLHRFNLEKELQDSVVDYLVITSHPPKSCGRDAVYNYKVKVMSKKGGVKYRIDSGPKGMTISEDGELRWRVPLALTASTQNVVIGVKDATGQEKFQSFVINILDRLP